MTIRNMKLFVDITVLTVFSLGVLYILDDIARVISVDQVLAEIILYGFFIGTPIAFFLSAFGIRQWKDARFKLYFALTGLQLLMASAFVYIVMSSQV